MLHEVVDRKCGYFYLSCRVSKFNPFAIDAIERGIHVKSPESPSDLLIFCSV